MVLKTLTDLKIVANNFKIMANHSFRNVICNWVYPTWCALLWERIWHKHISMRVQQVPALQEQKWMLPCWQTGRLCQRSQTKAIWSTAACPSTNHTARGDGYSVTTVQFTQSTTDTSLQLLIRKGFRFTLTLRVMVETWDYGTYYKVTFEWQHRRHHQFNHIV